MKSDFSFDVLVVQQYFFSRRFKRVPDDGRKYGRNM
jgi:hypothetical protein